MKKQILILLLPFFSFSFYLNINAQFQGEINFEKTAGAININYKYFVNNDIVRIEEINNEGIIDGIQILNLKEKKVYALSPERKLFLEAPTRRPTAEMKLDIKKTGKTKSILGKTCEEIIVINKAQDRKIVYWVTEGDYSFFIPMLETLNRKEKQAIYYLKIKDMDGYWPMKSSEFVLSTGDLVSELVTKVITRGEMDQSLFEIPADYTKFEH